MFRPRDIRLHNAVRKLVPRYLLLDGVDCRTYEKSNDDYNVDRTQFSHKHNHGGVKYEVGVDAFESKIVWISGPWRAGKHDREIFGEESGLRSLIPEEKVVVCDRVYRNKGKDGNGNDILALPNIGDSAGLFTFKSRLRSRHESLNGRLKDFKILSDTFHHPHGMHKYAFEAVCVLVQFSMDHGHPLFDANTVTLDDE